MTLGRRLVILVAVLTASLAAIIADRAYLLASGAPVLLRTAPVDPRSLFRGDYVRLDYDIARLAPAALDGDDVFARRDEIFVTLRQDGRHAVPVGLYHRRPASAPGLRVIQGRVTSAGKDQLRVDYGIASYFVPEGKGGQIEQAVRDRAQGDARLEVEVALSRSGRAAIKTLYLDGNPVYRERIF